MEETMTRRNDLDQIVQKEKKTHSEFGRIHLKYDSLGLQRLSILSAQKQKELERTWALESTYLHKLLHLLLLQRFPQCIVIITFGSLPYSTV